MVAFLAQLVMLGVGAGIVLVLVMPRPVFVITIAGDVATVRRGKVSKAFANDCARLCRENDISSATIRGVRQQGRIRLKFCRRVPERVRQKFRNAWTAYS